MLDNLGDLRDMSFPVLGSANFRPKLEILRQVLLRWICMTLFTFDICWQTSS